MITYQLPRKIRFIPASAIYTATFNTPTIGKYDFNGQQKIFVAKLLPNTVYLIDAFSIAANIAQEDFLSSINTVPLLNLRKTLNDENIFDVPLQIQNYSTDRQIVHFFKTGLDNCGLAANLTGILDQTANLVGVSNVTLSINFSLHAVDASDFEKLYRNEQ
jgi:hypothetical protein